VAAVDSASAVASEPRRPPTAASRKLSFSENRELGGMESSIASAEARVAELEGNLEDPAFYRGRATEVPGLVAALDG
jgi:hypothetical protein